MKALINYIGKSGGGPAFALEFAKGLVKNNVDVYVIVSAFVDNRSEWEQCEEFKEVYFVNTNKKRGKAYYFAAQLKFMLFGKWKIKRHFKEIPFDYVITTMQHLWSIDISHMINAKRIAWICHDPIPHSGSKKMDTYLGNQFARIADETIVLTKKFIPVVQKRWGISPEHIHYMPHGRMSTYIKKEVSSSVYSKEKYNFLFFGYFREYKGLRVLASAYRKLVKLNPNVTLTLAGSGNYSKYEEDYKDLPNLTVVNRYIKDEEVAGFFQGANVITVMPYLDATQSGVSLTAMEFGSVVIASDTGGLKEQLDDGKIGIYCEPNSVDDLCEKMLFVSKHPEIIEQQKYLMKEYLKKLDWGVVTKGLLDSLSYKKDDKNLC